MKTSLFCQLIELAISEQYGEESSFDTVPYIPEDGGAQKSCLGVFLLEDVHMGEVAAKAMHLLWSQMNNFGGSGAPEADIDEAMNDFVNIMGSMKIAPYMQWHCAYFPYLTQAQIDAEQTGDTIGLRMERNPDLLNPDARDVLIELQEIGELEGVDITAAETYIYEHEDDMRQYRNNGMRVGEIVDTVRSLAATGKVQA